MYKLPPMHQLIKTVVTAVAVVLSMQYALPKMKGQYKTLMTIALVTVVLYVSHMLLSHVLKEGLTGDEKAKIDKFNSEVRILKTYVLKKIEELMNKAPTKEKLVDILKDMKCELIEGIITFHKHVIEGSDQKRINQYMLEVFYPSINTQSIRCKKVGSQSELFKKFVNTLLPANSMFNELIEERAKSENRNRIEETFWGGMGKRL